LTGPVITVSGPHGTGKSTYARALADALGLRYICAGEIFRQLAKERGMSLGEFSQIAANDPAIDEIIDERTKAEAKTGGVVIDAQLAAWMAKEVADVKVLIVAADEVRFKRIAEREGISIEAAKQQTQARESIQRDRYRKYYGVDVGDLSIFDLTIDTGRYPINEARTVVIESVRSFLEHKHSKASGATIG